MTDPVLAPLNATSTPPPSLFAASPTVDHLMGVLYLLCLIFGVPANFTALSYFLLQSRDLSTCLYLVITVVDMLTCSSSSIIAVNMFTGRAPFLFQFQWFCIGWRWLFKSLQRLSVFLVLILSISRTVVLVAPLHPVSKRAVLLTVGGSVAYLVLETAVLERLEVVIYDRDDVYCYEQANERLISVINDSLHTASLALPLMPIVCSCIISVHYVRGAAHYRSHNDVLRRRATVTVILLTTTYLVFNIPLIANLVLWILTINRFGGWPGPVYGTSGFMYMYCWNITDVLFVGLNATCNPVIYYMRFPSYKRWCVGKLRRVYQGQQLIGSDTNLSSSWRVVKQYIITPEMRRVAVRVGLEARRGTVRGSLETRRGTRSRAALGVSDVTSPPLSADPNGRTNTCCEGDNGERVSSHQQSSLPSNTSQTIMSTTFTNKSTDSVKSITSINLKSLSTNTNSTKSTNSKSTNSKKSNDIELEEY